jgi:hypothetical protein
MAYTPREIKDRVAVGDDIFQVEDLGNNQIRLIPAPTHVSEPGTPINKALLQPIEDYLATGVVPVERTITAGNGLTGGGALSTNRTISLGTPGTLSGATSNNVTSTSHTHAISVATHAEAVAGTDNVKLMTPLRVKEVIAQLDFYKILDDFISSGGVGINQVAGIKNSMYRGKNLGTSVTPEQCANISNGTFKDLYIGDYWVIDGTAYIIAAFNYYLNSGDSVFTLTTNHVTLVPATTLSTDRMNPSDITNGGYVGSEMYTQDVNQAKSKIRRDFAGHVVVHRRFLCNAVENGQASAGEWFGSDIELMNEVMVYGSVVNGKGTSGSYNIGSEKSQLPLFALRPDLANIGNTWWLRDVVSATAFAAVAYDGRASFASASNNFGVRPVFSIS